MSQFLIDHAASLRFQKLVSYALRELSEAHPNAYAISLMCFDGVTIQHINEAIKAEPYITHEGVCISWRMESGRIARFILSPMSLKIFSGIKCNSNRLFDQDSFDFLYLSVCASNNRTGRSTFVKDQLSWFKENTNGLLFGHLSEAAPMFGVPNSAFARLDSGLSLSAPNMSEMAAESAISETISGCFEPNDFDKESSIVASLKKACKKRSSKYSDYQIRQQMLQECLKLVVLAKYQGQVSSLLVAWAISLITHPTRYGNLLSPNSISTYLSKIAAKVHDNFKGENVFALDVDAFQTIYQKVSKDNNGASAAISSFHYFLENWFDAPPLACIKFSKNIEHVPVANVIWPHEIKLIMEWLDQATCDERLIEIWRMGITLGISKRIRVGEFFDIRIEDVELLDSILILNVRGQKTKASRRKIVIDDEPLYSLFANFLIRRRKEFAYDDDYLFGDPHRPEKIYKLGQVYHGFNELLKAATGDRTASFHWLSHSVISFELKDLLCDTEQKLINPYPQTATNSAHFAIATTCSEYMHLQHIPLRKMLDSGLSKIKLTSQVLESWLGIKANTIRKHISNHELCPQSYYWDRMLTPHKVNSLLPHQGALIETSVAQFPGFLSANFSLGFQCVFDVLHDMISDTSTQDILLKNGLTIEAFQRIQSSLANTLSNYKIASELEIDYHDNLSMVDLKELKLFGFDFKQVRQNKYLPIYQYFLKLKPNQAWEQLDGCKAWAILKGERKTPYLSVEKIKYLDQFFRLLKSARLNISNIAILYGPKAYQEELHLRVGEVFISSFGRRPYFFEVKNHRSHPKIYMSLCNKELMTDKVAYGSATSMAGFNAIFLAALTWIGCVTCNP